MKPWKDLSMKERGAFIRVGVKNGITSVDGIRDAYNKFACGGHKFDDGGPKLTPEEQYQEMVEAKMMSAPLLRFGDERGSWRWSRNLGAEAYMPEIEVVAENKSGKSTTKRGEQPTAIKNERLTEEEKKEEEEFWTGQRNSEPEMAVTRRPEGYWREQGLKAPILSTGRPADEPIDWQGTGYNHSPEYQKAMSQYRIANMTPEQRWAMTDDQMFKGEVLNAGMGIMMAPAFNPIASIGSGIMDLKYNKNKDWTNYVGDALAIGLPIAGTALNAPTYYRNIQNLYNQGRRVYDMYKYLESLPTSYTGVPQSKVAQLEAVRAGKIPRTFNVWTSDNKLLGKHVYAKKNGIMNGKLYNVRDLNRNRYMLDTPRAKDYGEGVNAVSWYSLPYDIQATPNGLKLVDLPNSKIEINYAPRNTIRERLTSKTRTYAESKHKNTTDLILYRASRMPNNQGVIFNDITDGTATSVFKLPFEKYHRVVHWDTPIIKERVYNPKAQLLLTPNEPTWMSAWRYRNNQGLRNRMLMEKGYKPDKIFSPQELRENIMNTSYARGGRLAHKFDGKSNGSQQMNNVPDYTGYPTFMPRYEDNGTISEDAGFLGHVKGRVGNFFNGVDTYADAFEDPLLLANMGLGTATLAYPNPYTAIGAYGTALLGSMIDAYQGTRSLLKGNLADASQNAIELGLGLISAKVANRLLKASEHTVPKIVRQIGRRRYSPGSLGFRSNQGKIITISPEEQTRDLVLGAWAAGTAPQLAQYGAHRLQNEINKESNSQIEWGNQQWQPEWQHNQELEQKVSSVYDTFSPEYKDSIIKHYNEDILNVPYDKRSEEDLITDYNMRMHDNGADFQRIYNALARLDLPDDIIAAYLGNIMWESKTGKLDAQSSDGLYQSLFQYDDKGWGRYKKWLGNKPNTIENLIEYEVKHNTLSTPYTNALNLLGKDTLESYIEDYNNGNGTHGYKMAMDDPYYRYVTKGEADEVIEKGTLPMKVLAVLQRHIRAGDHKLQERILFANKIREDIDALNWRKEYEKNKNKKK